MKKLMGAVILTATSSSAFAQDTQETNSEQGSWSWGGNAALVSIDETAAASQGIEDSAYLVGLTASYTKDQWVTTLGVDIVVYDDNEEFSQTVIGDGLFNDGDVSTESSSASGVLLSVATGYQWRFTDSDNVLVTLQGGFGELVASERSISNCSNCFSEDIDIDGGLFLKASVMTSGDSFALGLYAQQFLTGDGLDNAFGISINGAF